MFTGIIEEIGKVKDIKSTKESIVLSIAAKKIVDDVHLGDSIAVNGVCLTVTSFNAEQFTVDVMPETVKATSLKLLARDSSVNLERAMSASGRFGGHFVSGHVDGVGKIIHKERRANAVYYQIEVPEQLCHYMLLKGSVTVDGTSLTLFGLNDTTFTISLIPHTLQETILGEKGVGDIVNIECDMLGKYVEKFLGTSSKELTQSRLTEHFLQENGFL